MRATRRFPVSLLAAASVLAAPAAHALDIQAGDWKFSFNGNVNVHYINSQCDDTAEKVTLATSCNAGTGNDAKSDVSTVSNGLLPAAFVFGASTTQKGWDLAATLGLYPGISTNDGGTPNFPSGTGNTALGTTGLDVRQVFMTFGNKDVGSFMFGRNFGLFGFDAIINDMTIPGVGGAGAAASAAPSNTSLGSIGLGYIYCDTLAQMNYTTPDFSGFKLTVGIFDPLQPIGSLGGTDSQPGIHGKVTFTSGPIYVSSSVIHQKNNVSDPNGSPNNDFSTTAFDVGGKFTMGPLEALAWYYNGSGIGTTGLLVVPAFNDATGAHKRDSDGFLAQVTYKIADTKLGVNYGESKLDLASGEAASALVKKNSKYTLGVYHSLTPNLTLLAEFTDGQSKAHDGDKIKSSSVNVGAFLSF